MKKKKMKKKKGIKTMKIIDISEHNGKINFNAVKTGRNRRRYNSCRLDRKQRKSHNRQIF